MKNCARFSLTDCSLMFPDLKAEEIEGVHINRAIKVQPLTSFELLESRAASCHKT